MLTNASRGFQREPQMSPRVTRPLAARQDTRPFVVRRAERTHAGSARLALWLTLFALLNVGDLVSTYAGLHSGMREGNPLMSTLLLSYGFGALIGYKIVVVCAVAVGIYILRGFSKGIASTTIWICNALVCAVVIVNLTQFTVR